ncbi:MAG: hypothetical protein N2171_07895 [Clostridia bacterium]|nr:hypothetical protein [Clostridia bacterium]
MRKYICLSALEAAVFSLSLFFAPVFASWLGANVKVLVYIVLTVVLAGEYICLWHIEKGKFFTLPLSFLFILIVFLFYFNTYAGVGLRHGIRAVLTFFVLPYIGASVLVSFVLHKIRAYFL